MTPQAHILIVDDEPAIRLFLSDELQQAGYRVTTAANGTDALNKLQQDTIDVILLDLKMDDMDGLQVMREIERYPLPPVVILLTAHASLDSAIEAMRRGGHDYLLKPCRTEDLLSSVQRGLARRREQLQQQEILRIIELSARQLRIGPQFETTATFSPPDVSQTRFLQVRDLVLDCQQETVQRQGQTIHLTPSEFRLLKCLMERAGQTVPLDNLMMALHRVSGTLIEMQSALNTHLWNLRRKLGQATDGKPYIVNIRGRGYQFISA